MPGFLVLRFLGGVEWVRLVHEFLFEVGRLVFFASFFVVLVVLAVLVSKISIERLKN